MSKIDFSWERFKKYFYENAEMGFQLDISRIPFDDGYFAEKTVLIENALSEMTALEQGAIANGDEKRMVGHYWLRTAEKSPNTEIEAEIEATVKKILTFSENVHHGSVRPEKSAKFTNVLLIGIGGSALGPQFVSEALRGTNDAMTIAFIDNTDPDGADRVLAELGERLKESLAIVISKSGGTKETRNGMLEVKHAYEKAGLNFARHCVAVTSQGSQLYQLAIKEKFLDIFPMWDWVGGRTSEMSAVGLLPAALQGFNIQAMREGASQMDAATRHTDVMQNPALMLSLMWLFETNGRGEKDMVIVPYKDRLTLLSKYLQQLVMESLGKELDRDGKKVNQGIAVYGNKGSTDQHAYIQQLRDGVNNFFMVFIEVLKQRNQPSFEVEPGVTSGDYLQGFLLGTRQALAENHRSSITITIHDVTPRSVGQLIALFERAVGYYAAFVNINAYHQPGVEAGKKAAAEILKLKNNIQAALRKSERAMTPEETAAAAGTDDIEATFKILNMLSANADKRVEKIGIYTGAAFIAK